jgi:Tol biopolymer transport system component
MAAAAVILVAMAGIAAWLMTRAPAAAPPSIVRLRVALPENLSVWLGRGSSVAISPDSTRIVFVGSSGGGTQLYVRALDREEITPIAGTEAATDPFFSPDGEWVGFGAGGKLKKVSLRTGIVATIADAANIRGEAWGDDDSILFTPSGSASIWRVPASGGKPAPLTETHEGELSHRWPQLLPGSRSVLFTIWNDTGFEGGRIAVQSLDTGERKVLVQGGGYGRVIPVDGARGYLLYAQDEGMLAAPFDLQRLELTAPPVPVFNGVLTNLSGGAHASLSPGGLLAYLPGNSDEVDKTLVWVDRRGATTDAATIHGLSFTYRLSPDGTRLVRMNSQGPDRDVWIDDLERSIATRVTFGGIHGSPLWTPDGRRIVYSVGTPNSSLFWKSADGTGTEERLTDGQHLQLAMSISPDGKFLSYTDYDPVTTADIWILPLEGDRTPRRYLQTSFSEGYGMISPDGRLMAFQSNESGRFEIYLMRFPEGGAKTRVSNEGGYAPRWNPRGGELFYNTETGVAAVTVGSAPALQAGAPRLLFKGTYVGAGDVSKDGTRFLMVKSADQESSPRTISIVLNWLDELKSKVPLK